MSGVKKWCFVIVAIVAIASMFLVAGCEEAKETVAESKETVAESMVKGEIYENSKFSITVPDGWVITYKTESSVLLNTKDEVFGMIVEISRSNVTEAEIKAEVEELIKSKNGTPLEEVTTLSVKFFKTSVIDGSLDQTAYLGVRNGERVSIVLAGKDHKNNNEMKAMMESIKFK
jgi:predicted Zn-dependent peptidase